MNNFEIKITNKETGEEEIFNMSSFILSYNGYDVRGDFMNGSSIEVEDEFELAYLGARIQKDVLNEIR